MLTSILLVALQLSFFVKLTGFLFAPNLVLAGILAYAVLAQEKKSAWWVVIIPALILDLLVGRPFGFLTLSFWLTFYLIDWLARILFKQNDLPAIIFLTVLGILFFEFSLVGFVKLAAFFHLANKINFVWSYFYETIPLSVLSNGILCLVFIWLWQKIIPKIGGKI